MYIFFGSKVQKQIIHFSTAFAKPKKNMHQGKRLRGKGRTFNLEPIAGAMFNCLKSLSG